MVTAVETFLPRKRPDPSKEIMPKADFHLGPTDFSLLSSIPEGLQFEHASGWEVVTTGVSRSAENESDGKRHYQHEVLFRSGPYYATRRFADLRYYYHNLPTEVLEGFQKSITPA